MFTRTQHVYDAIYSWKDYAKEAGGIRALIQRHCSKDKPAVLDVACGTGKHLEHLKASCRCWGLDIDPQLAEVARQRNPEIEITVDDMIRFDLDRTFDAVICLFSAIGYVGTVKNLESTADRIGAHLEQGGVCIFEPWLDPAEYTTGMLHASVVDEPDLKVARMNVSGKRGNLSVIDFHYLIGQGTEISYCTEKHELALFTDSEYRGAFEKAGFHVAERTTEFSDRGHYVCVKD